MPSTPRIASAVYGTAAAKRRACRSARLRKNAMARRSSPPIAPIFSRPWKVPSRPRPCSSASGVTSVPQGDSVRLEMSDGSSSTADAVIGADGIHSTVRAALFGAGGAALYRHGFLSHHFPGRARGTARGRRLHQMVGADAAKPDLTFLIDSGRERFCLREHRDRNLAQRNPGRPPAQRPSCRRLHRLSSRSTGDDRGVRGHPQDRAL